MNIDLNLMAMKWHHLTHKASYHLGFKMHNHLCVKAILQKSVFSISMLEDNPFKGKDSPYIHDIIIMH